MQENIITIGGVVRGGWNCFKARPWFWVGTMVLCGIIWQVMDKLSSVIFQLVASSGASEVIGWSVVVGLFLLAILVQYRLQMGLMWMGVITVEGRRARIGDLLAKPRLFWRFLFALLMFQLMVMVGSLFLFVPGLYLVARFLPVGFVLLDRETSILESFEQAQRLTEGHRGKLFALVLLPVALVFGLFAAITWPAMAIAEPTTAPGGLGPVVVVVAMLLAVIVLGLVVAPIILLCMASLYRDLKIASARQVAPA